MLDMVGAPGWLPRPWAQKGRRAAAGLKQAAVDAIARRRKSGETRPDLLGLLLAARDPETGKGLSETELRDNVVTFIGAGHETTALALTSALYLIANAPEVQAKLLEEVTRDAGGAPITADMLDALEYHEQVIKEAMRLYPPIAILQRRAVRDVRVGDVELKAGDEVVCASYVMHRSRLFWERPEAFDPDRFSPERSVGRHKHALLPFGAGSHVCIGKPLAFMETVAILALLMRKLRFAPDPHHQIRPIMRLTVRPDGGMPIRVRSRPARRLTDEDGAHNDIKQGR